MEKEINKFTQKPLSDRMCPNSLENFIGNTRIMGKNNLLDRAIKINSVGSCIFFGSSGTEKTTLAHVIASTCKVNLEN